MCEHVVSRHFIMLPDNEGFPLLFKERFCGQQSFVDFSDLPAVQHFNRRLLAVAYGDVVQRVLSRPLATKLSHASSEGVTREEDRCKLSDSSNFQLVSSDC